MHFKGEQDAHRGSISTKPFREFSEIIDRVEQVRLVLRLSKSRFCKEIGMKPQTYNNFVGTQGSKPNIELLAGIITHYRVNPMWVLTGNGTMFQATQDTDVEWTISTPAHSDDFAGAPDAPAPGGVEPVVLALRRIETVLNRVNVDCSRLLGQVRQILQHGDRTNLGKLTAELHELLEHIEGHML
jgi:hypothetical protein